MKFIVENHTFRKMIQAVGKKFPGTTRPDAVVTLTVFPGMAIAATICRAGAVLALATEEGQCNLPRAEFEGVLATFKSEDVLSIRASERGLKIKSFTMPVLNFTVTPTPVRKYEWFGSLPPACNLSPAEMKTVEDSKQ